MAVIQRSAQGAFCIADVRQRCLVGPLEVQRRFKSGGLSGCLLVPLPARVVALAGSNGPLWLRSAVFWTLDCLTGHVCALLSAQDRDDRKASMDAAGALGAAIAFIWSINGLADEVEPLAVQLPEEPLVVSPETRVLVAMELERMGFKVGPEDE